MNGKDMGYRPIFMKHFEDVLLPKGFFVDAGSTTKSGEIVFSRSHERDSRLKIKIYTSIPSGSAMTRDSGKDAIRICLTLTKGDREIGVGKSKRVNRTGSPEDVVKRAVDRARDMWYHGKTVEIY